MKNIVLFLVFISMLSGSSSSVSYYLDFEGDSSGRVEGAVSASYIVSGDVGAYSGSYSSAHYEINKGWFFTVNIDSVPPPAVVTLLSETLINGNIKLSWNSTADEDSFIRGYRIYRSVKQAENGILLGEIDGNIFTDAGGLFYGITYYYRIKPVDIAGNETVTGNILLPGLSKSLSTSVTSLTAVSQASGKIEITWLTVSGISYFRIYRSENFGEKGAQINTDGSTVSGLFSQSPPDGLNDGKKYFYTVQGVDDSAHEQEVGNNQSAAVSDSRPPTLPVINSSSHQDSLPSADNCPRFTWVESDDPKAPAGGASGVKGYFYCLSRNSTEIWNPGWLFRNSLSAAYEGLADGDWYFFAVAEDFAGNRSAAASRKINITTSGEISGKLFEADGLTPLVNTRLELFSGVSVIRSGRTDTSGSYTFSCVPFGEYKLKIYKAGHNPCEAGPVTLSKSSGAVILNKAINVLQNTGSNGTASYPNPCKTGTVTFVYRADKPSKVLITVYDASGETAAVIEEYAALPGFCETKWNASAFPSGVFFYLIRLENNGNTFSFPVKKLSLVR